MKLRCRFGFHKWTYTGQFDTDERECLFCEKKQRIKNNGIWEEI